MKTNLNVFLVGNQLQSLKSYKRELDHLGDPTFSFCINATLSLTDLGSFPDILIINRGRDDLFGLNELRKMKRLNPDTHVILAVSADNVFIGRHAMKRGAISYLIKGEHELQQVRSLMGICKMLATKSSLVNISKQPARLAFFQKLITNLKTFLSVPFIHFKTTNNH